MSKKPAKPGSQRPIGKQAPSPARVRKTVPAPAPATLAEQKSDFTAEGSPPPGQVGR
jgi:hypothetical protein